MPTEAVVQVALDGAGKRIKNLKLVQMPQADGTYVDVYVQDVVLVDDQGRQIDFSSFEELLRDVLAEVTAIRETLGEAFETHAAFGKSADGTDDDSDSL